MSYHPDPFNEACLFNVLSPSSLAIKRQASVLRKGVRARVLKQRRTRMDSFCPCQCWDNIACLDLWKNYFDLIFYKDNNESSSGLASYLKVMSWPKLDIARMVTDARTVVLHLSCTLESPEELLKNTHAWATLNKIRTSCSRSRHRNRKPP